MSFAFGFTSDDISDDEVDIDQRQPIKTENEASAILTAVELITPSFVDLSDVLNSLKNIRITFDEYVTPGGITVYRRQVYDIKHQIMVEEDDVSSNAIHDILMGTSDELDLKKNVYEGGFKLWECSYDLVDAVLRYSESGEFNSLKCYLELGCGTSLPTCYLLSKLLSSSVESSIKKVIISDFNLEVLRLVSIPNIIISWAMTLSPEELSTVEDKNIPLNNDELILTPALLSKFQEQLEIKNIELLLVHGSWGAKFCDLLIPQQPDFILTSETIYSLESLPIVLEILLLLLENKPAYLALVAAKEYYFGVGGSIIEFMQKLLYRKPSSMAVDTIGNNLGQLKRDIVRMAPAK